MDIRLKLTLDADIETVWDALARPAQMQAAASPFIRVRSLEKGGFPAKWIPDTPHRVALSLFGLIPLGTQVVEPHFELRSNGERAVVDSGAPTSGPLTSLTEWEHTMAVSAINDRQTSYRDRLHIGGGWLTVPFGIGLWFMWQLRGRSLVRTMRRISRGLR